VSFTSANIAAFNGRNKLVGRMVEWFDNHRQASPDESTIKEKIKPLWQKLQRAEPQPILSKAR
jgi:hypothetical protein